VGQAQPKVGDAQESGCGCKRTLKGNQKKKKKCSPHVH